MDYLDRQYGICTRKAVNYHLDTVYQMTNLHLGKCQKRKKKKKKVGGKDSLLTWNTSMYANCSIKPHLQESCYSSTIKPGFWGSAS